MKEIFADRSFRLSILLTLIFMGTGIAFLFLGLADYSWVLFVLLPIVLGIAIGAMPNKKYTLYGAIITAALVLIGLYIPGLSGLLCIVMTLPVIVPLIFLGYVISHLAKRYKQINSTDRIHFCCFLLSPL